MKPFMDADFLLQTDTAKTLYHEAAEKMPIFDYHNHLNPQEILEDRQMENLTRVWLGGDHYKWRAMRAMGFSEDLITGNADDYDKYLAFAETIENAIGNPLYHWIHLELQRYFGITTPLSRATAKELWDEANAKLQTKEFTVRNLILNQHVSHLCTTDDPADDLHCIWHYRRKTLPAAFCRPSARTAPFISRSRISRNMWKSLPLPPAGRLHPRRIWCMPSPAASTSSSPPAALSATTALRAASMCHARLLRRMMYLKIA